jgi:hypothetical protein
MPIQAPDGSIRQETDIVAASRGLRCEVAVELRLCFCELSLWPKVTLALDDDRTNCYVQPPAILGWTLKDDSLIP